MLDVSAVRPVTVLPGAGRSSRRTGEATRWPFARNLIEQHVAVGARAPGGEVEPLWCRPRHPGGSPSWLLGERDSRHQDLVMSRADALEGGMHEVIRGDASPLDRGTV